MSNEGLLLNDYSGNSPLSVKILAETKNMQKFELTILSNNSLPNEFLLFAFPHWYTNGKEIYPPTPASISVAVGGNVQHDSNGSLRYSYQIKAGSTDTGADGSAITRNLGVNVFAVKSDIDNENIQVGFAPRAG